MDSKILKRLEQLLNDGVELHSLTHIVPASNNNIEHESLGKDGDAQYVEWKIKIKHLLKLICGNNSIHFEAFLNAERYQFYDTNAVVLNRLLPVIKATYDDFKNGFLITFKQIVQAEVFDNELEQAKSLLESGYKNAAAVIAGVVLETAIKELCLNNNIDLEKKNLNRLNEDLVKAGVYNTLQQKQILALADIRNKAAHGDYDEFTKEDVERMISDIERFLLNNSY